MIVPVEVVNWSLLAKHASCSGYRSKGKIVKYSIGETARISGVGIETIRYYEREGIVPPPVRTEAGRRVYDDDGLSQLRFIRRCRDLGFPIGEIRMLLSLATERQRACADVRAISEKHLASVRQKIRDLVELEAALADLHGQCREGRQDCPMLGRLFGE